MNGVIGFEVQVSEAHLSSVIGMDFMVKIVSLAVNFGCPRLIANLCSNSFQQPMNEIGTQSGRT